jgi:hypothetical protein
MASTARVMMAVVKNRPRAYLRAKENCSTEVVLGNYISVKI